MFLVLALLGVVALASADLVEQFRTAQYFWQQIEIAKKIVALKDKSVLPQLEPWLNHEDRHIRGNTAFVFAGLGDARGFETITVILNDRAGRPEGHGIPGGRWNLPGQISADRYYAAHLLGDLKDPRAVPILIPLLHDKDVAYIVPWSLGEIGDRAAIPPLIELLSDSSADLRALAIYALTALRATEALPKLREMLDDSAKISFDGLGPVSDAAREAIAKLKPAATPRP
jgi:HEAT repeat protein